MPNSFPGGVKHDTTFSIHHLPGTDQVLVWAQGRLSSNAEQEVHIARLDDTLRAISSKLIRHLRVLGG